MSVSIFIQTLNEQDNLPGLLDSLAGFDDIVVLDSLSTDDTRRIAESRGCRWFEHAFDGRGPHQNWAMEHIDFKHRWVFYLDADERMTPELKREIESIAAKWASGEWTREYSPVAYYCGRKNYFRGRWLRHAMPPGNIMRFFQPPHIRFERLANPVPIVDGEVGYLKEHFLHYNFSKGLREWIERHNRYSSYEAAETVKALENNPVRIGNLFSGDRNTRRLELKNISFRLPFRPFIKFFYMYILGRGFLDGRAGLTYCTLQAVYEYFIVLKAREIRQPELSRLDRGETADGTGRAP
ncbi:MAG: glycosyltransferase family 2 protein [Phycisphaerales bacterium]|nr:glycosyltransferase family 2 protein [Planctomycetota bacterium]MCH8508056.1 glycosyltransferase family 2 protein [Phycisphaerales bacterium]